MENYDMIDLSTQTNPFEIMFHNCWVSQITAERVSHTILSMMNPSFREIIPTAKYITGTITICDGYSSQNMTFHSNGFTINPKPTAGEIDEETNRAK